MNENLKIQEQQDSLKKFLELFPEERIKNLTLKEYSNRDKKCFTHHMEMGILRNVGGIQGSPEFKFGIYNSFVMLGVIVIKVLEIIISLSESKIDILSSVI